MRVHPDDRKKKHHAKSRHGCISCKKRHLKCDEARPGCNRCIKDFGKCEGYQTPRTWLFEPDHPRDANAVATDSSDATTGSPVSTSSRSTLSRQSSDLSQPGSASPEPEHTRQKRWAPKSRSGCLTCKKRRIKCDEARPSCSRCTVSNRVCEYQTPPTSESENSSSSEHVETVISSPEVTRRRSASEESNDSLLPLFFVNASPYQNQTDHQTLCHWLGRAESCSVITRSFGSFNILGVELPKLAWDYKSVKHGLLAAASVTASLEKFSLGDDDNKKASITALKHSSLAINSLLTENAEPEVMVVVAFVFWFMEAWVGSWNRAVMHLSSAARMCREGSAKGQVSEAVSWYVGVCDDAVPAALRDQDFLAKTHDMEGDYKNEQLCLRLRYGIREVEIGLSLIDEVQKKVMGMRPSDCDQLLEPLLDHQAQMRWLLASFVRKHQNMCGACAGALPPPTAHPPLYSRVSEQIFYFLDNDTRYDGLLLFIRLKMLQRSIPLFVAGTDMEIRRDTARSIPIRALIKEETSPELPFIRPGCFPTKIEPDPIFLYSSAPEVG